MSQDPPPAVPVTIESPAGLARRLRAPPWGRVFLGLWCACVAGLASLRAQALEVNGGVSVGGLQVGTEPKLAVSPFVGVAWHSESGFSVSLHNMFSVVVASRVGVHDRASAALGYAWNTGDFSVGPSMSFYSLLVCGALDCRRVEGAAPGAHVQVDWYFLGPLGASLSGNVAWYGGASSVLPGSVAVMATAGPILRLEAK